MPRKVAKNRVASYRCFASVCISTFVPAQRFHARVRAHVLRTCRHARPHTRLHPRHMSGHVSKHRLQRLQSEVYTLDGGAYETVSFGPAEVARLVKFLEVFFFWLYVARSRLSTLVHTCLKRMSEQRMTILCAIISKDAAVFLAHVSSHPCLHVYLNTCPNTIRDPVEGRTRLPTRLHTSAHVSEHTRGGPSCRRVRPRTIIPECSRHFRSRHFR